MIDWVIHYVSNDIECECCGKKLAIEDYVFKLPYFANIHTHGLSKYGQRELCISVGIDAEIITNLLNIMGILVQEGKTIYTEGIRNDILRNGYDVKFITFENDDTLYMILPDANNKFPGEDGCEEPYCYQETYAKIISDDKE